MASGAAISASAISKIPRSKEKLSRKKPNFLHLCHPSPGLGLNFIFIYISVAPIPSSPPPCPCLLPAGGPHVVHQSAPNISRPLQPRRLNLPGDLPRPTGHQIVGQVHLLHERPPSRSKVRAEGPRACAQHQKVGWKETDKRRGA
eukprot:GHVT01041407.1.p1 GENE.GHVT01041407.1~~GHVT01041407.1.p1  ORF type:complete len:145 (-),score=18.79 GHVT01041407.1:4-438(-)